MICLNFLILLYGRYFATDLKSGAMNIANIFRKSTFGFVNDILVYIKILQISLL